MDLGSIATLTGYVSAISVDWIIFGGCALFLSFDALRAGPARVTALALALPIALYASALAAHTAYISSVATSDTLRLAMFVALTIGLFVVFYRIADSGADSLHVGYALLSGLAAASILMTILLQLPSSTWPWSVSNTFQMVFGASYALYWTMGGYLLLALTRR